MDLLCNPNVKLLQARVDEFKCGLLLSGRQVQGTATHAQVCHHERNECQGLVPLHLKVETQPNADVQPTEAWHVDL